MNSMSASRRGHCYRFHAGPNRGDGCPATASQRMSESYQRAMLGILVAAYGIYRSKK